MFQKEIFLVNTTKYFGREWSLEDALDKDLLLTLFLPIPKEGMNDPITQRIDGQLRNPEEVLTGQVALLLLVQARETAPEAFDLIRGDWKKMTVCFITNCRRISCNFFYKSR